MHPSLSASISLSGCTPIKDEIVASREGRGSWTANGRTDGRGRTRTGGRVTRAAFHFAGGACPIRRPLPPSLPRPHCPKNGGVTEQVLQMDSSHPTERVGAKLQGRGGAGRSENLLGVITASLSWSIIWISLFHADKEVTAREGWRGEKKRAQLNKHKSEAHLGP